MNSNSRYFLFVICLGFLIFSLQCTENPFFSDSSIDSRSLFGEVTLDDGQIPSDVFIWFEPFDISTRTDISGKFSMKLPSPSEQAAGGLTGIFKLYYYVANYKIFYQEVAISGGKVQRSQDYTALLEGEVPPVRLEKILDINTTSFALSRLENRDWSIETRFTVRAIQDNVTIETIQSIPFGDSKMQYIGGLVYSVDENNPFEQTFLFENPSLGHHTASFAVGSGTLHLLPMVAHISQWSFHPGHYTFKPFILVRQPGIPLGLLDNLGRQNMKFSTDYVNYPLKITNNIFHFNRTVE